MKTTLYIIFWIVLLVAFYKIESYLIYKFKESIKSLKAARKELKDSENDLYDLITCKNWRTCSKDICDKRKCKEFLK
jgi:hypothetical protein